MLVDYFKEKNDGKIILLSLFLGAFLSLAIYIFFSFKIYYFSDDFPLITEAIKYGIKTILFPIGSHLRPIVRLHFLIISHLSIYHYIINNFVSLIIYITSLLSFFFLLKEIYDEKTALLSTLFLTIIASYNEAVFWISANGVLYNFLFFNLSLLFYLKKRKFLSSLFLIFAFFSYETWIIFIPIIVFYKLWKSEKLKNFMFDSLFILSFLLIILQFIINTIFRIKITSYGTIRNISELPYRIMIYFVRFLSPFYTPAYLIFFILFFLMIIFLSYYIIKSGFDFKITFPSTLYFGAAFIFLLSSKIASRFYLFPASAFALFITLILKKLLNKNNKYIKIVLYSFIIYMIFVSLVFLYVDGTDYQGMADIYKYFVVSGEKNLLSLKQNDSCAILNKVDNRLLKKYFFRNIINKYGKIFYYRGRNSLGGFIKLNDYADFILIRKGLISKKIKCEKIKKIIEIGRENRYYSIYCFKTIKIK